MEKSSEAELGIIRTMGGRIAHDDELGFSYLDSQTHAARMTMPTGPQVADQSGDVDAGAMATLLDTVCGVGAMASLEFLEVVATIDLRIDYLRRLSLGEDIEARSEVCHTGGQPQNGSLVMHGCVKRRGDENEIARCTGRFIRRLLPQVTAQKGVIRQEAPRVAVSYSEFMGFQEGAQDSMILPYRPGLLGNGSLPSLHGGAIAALLQESGCLYMRRHARVKLPLATAHFSFLRFGRPADLHAMPEVIRLGSGATTIRVEAFQKAEAGRPVACAILTFAPL